MSKISIQGHRGARGYFPENTMEGFLAAVDMGADTLELDVVISSDQQVVVSHEAWMNEQICSLSDGSRIAEGAGKNYNLFRMTYDEIKTFDCGKINHPDFPEQKPFPTYKPLLSEVISAVNSRIKKNNLGAVNFNIEIKTEPADGLFNPDAKAFVELVYNEIIKQLTLERFSIQSFDERILNEVKKKNASVKLGWLVEKEDDLDTNLARLQFLPDFYNPDFVLVNKKLVDAVHEKGMKIIPWTVNKGKDIENLIALQVDGIISDYPDKVYNLVKKHTTP